MTLVPIGPPTELDLDGLGAKALARLRLRPTSMWGIATDDRFSMVSGGAKSGKNCWSST
jgi:hypothetical protein